ncbi:hypothetical protein QOT17_006830 [Balamuthia mandrillaris]
MKERVCCRSSLPGLSPSCVLPPVLLLSCLLACCVTSVTALACGQHSYSTVPKDPAPGEPFLLNLAITVWAAQIGEPPCVLTLLSHPEFDAWATDDLSVPTVPSNFLVDCKTQKNRCVVSGAGEAIISSQRHFNLPLSAVQPSTPLRYTIADGGASQNNALDIKIHAKFNLTSNFTAELPPSFVPGQHTVLHPSFNVSSSGPSSVQDGYCLVSFAPLSLLDRGALPPTCRDGQNGTIRCNFQNTTLPPATVESFAFRTIPLGPSVRDRITVEVPSCNNTAGDELERYIAPDPMATEPSPDIQLAFSFTNKTDAVIVPGELTAIGFNLSNAGQSTSLNTSMAWHFPPNLTIIQNPFTRSFCHIVYAPDVLSCTLDVKPKEVVASQVEVLADSSLADTVVDFSVDCKDELKKVLPKAKGQLQVKPFSKDVTMKVRWLSPSNMSTEREQKHHDFSVEAKSEGPSWARQVGCFFNFTSLNDDSSLAGTTFSSSLPKHACVILTDTTSAKHVLCQAGDLSTSAWTSFRFGLSSEQALVATRVEIGCQSITPNNFPLVSWSAVLEDSGAKPTIDPGAGETASQFPGNTPNLQLVPKQGAHPQNHLRLDFVFHSIKELDDKGQVVRNMSFPSSGYQSSFLDERTIGFFLEMEDDKTMEKGRKRVEWTFTVVEEEREFYVGNTTFKVGAGFNKWSVKFSGWAPSNLTASSSPTGHWTRTPEEKKEMAKWLEMKVSLNSLDGALTPQQLNHSLLHGGGTSTRGVWTTNHTQVTMGLLQVCLVDGRQRAAFARVEEEERQQWLVIRMPLGQHMFYDPDVQVLVDTRSDEDGGMNVKLVVAVSVSVGVAICAVVLVMSGAVVWRRRKLKDFSASLGAVNFSGEEFSMGGEGAEYAPLLANDEFD